MKPDGSSDSARELDKRMTELMAARNAFDAQLLAPSASSKPTVILGTHASGASGASAGQIKSALQFSK